MSTSGKQLQHKYKHTDHTDALIRRAYASEHYQRRAIVQVADGLGWPKWIVYRRAVRLGVIQPMKKEPPWSDAETELLEQLSHLDPVVIGRKLRKAGFSRTPTAVTVRLKRLGFSKAMARQDAGLYSSRQLAMAMGCDAHTIARWISKGLLKAKRAGTARTAEQHGDHWEIHEADVRALLMEHTAAVDFRKIDKFWMVDVLTRRGRTEHG